MSTNYLSIESSADFITYVTRHEEVFGFKPSGIILTEKEEQAIRTSLANLLRDNYGCTLDVQLPGRLTQFYGVMIKLVDK